MGVCAHLMHTTQQTGVKAMGKKMKSYHFAEKVITTSNKIPKDLEESFARFADNVANITRNVMGITITISEQGPRETLSSTFKAKYTGSPMDITFKAIFLPSKKSVDIGYETDISSDDKKQVVQMMEQQVRIIMGHDFPLVYDAAVGEDFTLGAKKPKKIKLSASEKHLDKMYNPQGQKLKGYEKASLELISQSIKPTPAPTGSKCMLHPDLDASFLCDLCKKPFCDQDLLHPLANRKIYLKSKKEMENLPHNVCPNCEKVALKKYGPTALSQISGFMDSH